MTESEWFDTYEPMPNRYPVNEGDPYPNAERDDTTTYYCRETYGAQLREVRRTEPQFVWSWIEDRDAMRIYNGYSDGAFMYWITDKPWQDGERIRVTSIYYFNCPKCGDQSSSEFMGHHQCSWCGHIEEN
jgi:hypothetical protein